MSRGGAETRPELKTVLHADLDAFYASVEQRDNPRLRDRPMMVGAGVVLSASYEARRVGVRTAMSTGQARRLCPSIIEVPPRMQAYSDASSAVFEIFRDTSPNVEGLSIDEAFLDVTGLHRLVGPGRIVAERLRNRVARDVGLAISVGCAGTKFLAKVASGVAKPDGLIVVDPGRELEFLHPLPIERLWGVGPVTAERLRTKGLLTVADVAALEPKILVGLVGRGAGHHLAALSRNEDPRRIEPNRRRRSIGSQRSFRRGELDRSEADAVVLEVVDRITARLRDAERVTRTVVLRLRFGDFASATRSQTLPQATAATEPILRTAQALLTANWPTCEDRGLTRIGVSLSNLADASAVQLCLPLGRADDQLDSAMDSIRQRFGTDSIDRACLLSRPDRSVPLLPD